MVQGRNLALQNILLKTKHETKTSISISKQSEMLLSLALVELLEAPNDIMRSMHKGRAPVLLNLSSIQVYGLGQKKERK